MRNDDIINAYLVRHGDTGETVITAFRNVLTDRQIQLLSEHRRLYPKDQIRPLPNADIPAAVMAASRKRSTPSLILTSWRWLCRHTNSHLISAFSTQLVPAALGMK